MKKEDQQAPRRKTGRTGELLVAADLSDRGFTVFLPFGGGIFDLYVWSLKKQWNVEVKSTSDEKTWKHLNSSPLSYLNPEQKKHADIVALVLLPRGIIQYYAINHGDLTVTHIPYGLHTYMEVD